MYAVGNKVIVVKPHTYGGTEFNDIPIGTIGIVTSVHAEDNCLVMRWAEDRGNYADFTCIEPVEPPPEEVKAAIDSILRSTHD